jgi:hypothetical protein
MNCRHRSYPRHRAEKTEPTTDSPNKSAPEKDFDIAKSRFKVHTAPPVNSTYVDRGNISLSLSERARNQRKNALSNRRKGRAQDH